MLDGVGKCQTSKVIGSLNIHDGLRSYVRMYVCTYVCILCSMQLYIHTYVHSVNPVYSNHLKDQVMVVFVDRWSLYRGSLVSLGCPVRQLTVITVDRWSFYTSHLQDSLRCTCIHTYMCACGYSSIL